MHTWTLSVRFALLRLGHVNLSPDGEQGEMLGHFPLHPLGHPNYTALRVRCVARSAGAHLAGRSQTRFAQTPRAPFPASPALLARVDGDLGSVQRSPVSQGLIVPTLQRGNACEDALRSFRLLRIDHVSHPGERRITSLHVNPVVSIRSEAWSWRVAGMDAKRPGLRSHAGVWGRSEC